MKQYFKLFILMITLMFSVCSCGVKEDEYKKEARYFYEQVNAVFRDANIDEEIEKVEVSDMGMFSKTLYDAEIKTICLTELISLAPLMEEVETSYECLQKLYIDNKDNVEIKNLSEEIFKEYQLVVELLEESDKENIIEKYDNKIHSIQSLNTSLYDYVKDVEGTSHKELLGENDKTIIDYNDDLQSIEQIADDYELGSQETPLTKGDEITINYIDNGSGRKGDSWYTATGVFTYRGCKDNIANLNFKLLDQESNMGMVLGDYGSGFTFLLIDSNLCEKFVPYDATYTTKEKNAYISVNKGGNVDFSIEVDDNTEYLVFTYVEVTEDNLNVTNMLSATLKKVWIKLD